MSEVNFFTAIAYQNVPESIISVILEKVDDYFYLGGKKAYVINERTETGQEKVILFETNSSIFYRIVKVISYFTLIAPLFMLVTKVILRSMHSFEIIDPEKLLEKEMDVSEATALKILDLMSQILERKDHEETTWLPRLRKLVEKRLLQNFYGEKGVVTGKEPIEVELETLNLDLDEIGHISLGIIESEFQKKTIKLRDAATEVIAEINRSIKESPETESNESKRCVDININNEPFKSYNSLGMGEVPLVPTQEQAERCWLPRIIKALENKKYIFKQLSASPRGYTLQA